jgi:IS1 family transposase
MSKVLLPAQGHYQEQLELDECGSFVYSKSTPVWIWAALCRRTHQIVSFTIGDRSFATGQQLWLSTPQAYRLSYTYSDYWQPYLGFLDLDCHEQCAKQEGQTNHIERFWATLRNCLGRLTRKTLSFSKALDPLKDILTVFIYHYNLDIFKEINSQNH